MPKKRSLKSLKKEADAQFSKWIRLQYSSNGLVACFTCGAIKLLKDMQAGHYVSRVKLATRFDERNVHPQCSGCNIFKSGNMVVYTVKLMNKYGQNIIKKLDAISKQESIKLTCADYEDMIAEYKRLQAEWNEKHN